MASLNQEGSVCYSYFFVIFETDSHVAKAAQEFPILLPLPP